MMLRKRVTCLSGRTIVSRLCGAGQEADFCVASGRRKNGTKGESIAAELHDLPHQRRGDRPRRRQAGMNIVRMPGAIVPFLPASCIS